LNTVPFTVKADLNLGERIAPYLTSGSADVEISEGTLPDSIEDEGGGVAYQIQKGKLLLNIPDGSRILTEDGNRITYQRGENSTDKDIALFISGSAWGALCYQRGLIPLHASAVEIDGNIHAFTGHSGAGKSTLAAGLSQRGYRFFTDDVLIFDPDSVQDGAYCYTGQKDLKLWGDAVKLTNSEAFGTIRDAVEMDKHFARPEHSSESIGGPLKSLYILKQKNEQSEPIGQFQSIQGGDALKQLVGTIYRPRYAEILMGRPRIFHGLKKLIESVNVVEFERIFLKEHFDDGVSIIANNLEEDR